MLQLTSSYGALTVDPLRLQAEPDAVMKHDCDSVSSAHQPGILCNGLRGPKRFVHNSPVCFDNTTAQLELGIGKCDAPEPDRQRISDLSEAIKRGSKK
jgi:hypothetical protein